MWRLIVLSVVFSACGFESKPGVTVVDDAYQPPDSELIPASDAAPDAPSDAGSQDPSCFATWLDGSVQLGGAAELTKVSEDGKDERDPWISRDGLKLYFAKQLTTSSNETDIYLATRADRTKNFDNAAEVPRINSSVPESRASLTLDEKQLALARTIGGKVDIYLATQRPDGSYEAPSTDHLGNINKDNVSNLDPFLSAGGNRLYLAPIIGGRQRIFVTTRTGTSEDFPAPTAIDEIVDGNASDADPALADDDRILVFSSVRDGAGKMGSNLWYATRNDPAQPFGRPRPVPTVNTDFNDGDPVLSPDGCEMYFASRAEPDHGDYDLYVAKVIKPATPPQR